MNFTISYFASAAATMIVNAVKSNFGYYNDNSVVNSTPVVNNTPVVNRKEQLVKFVDAIENDPSECIKWIEEHFQVDVDKPEDITRRVTLQEVMALSDTRKMKNSINSAIGMKALVYYIAFTQSGKTRGIMKTIWESGLLKGFPTVQYTMNRCGEGGRMKGDAEDFNKIVTICAKMLGMDRNEYTLLELNHSEEKGGDQKFLDNLKKEMETAPITPVYSILGNASKIKALGEKVIMDMGKYVPREDANIMVDGLWTNITAMKALLVIDESDSTVKEMNTKLSEVLSAPIDVCFAVPCPGSIPSYPTNQMPSISASFTSSLRVTASPQVYGYKKAYYGGIYDVVEVLTSQPSDKYWTYKKQSQWGCKQIDKVTLTKTNREGWEPMAASMMLDRECTRHGFCASIRGTAKQIHAALKASKMFPGLISIAWSGDGVTVYTKSVMWVEKFQEQFGQGNSKDCGSGVWKFTGKKGSKIPDYRALIDFIYSVDDIAEIPKTLLFARDMALRGTPIKGYNHVGHLSDMYYELSGFSHDEFIIQIVGRLTGIDSRTQQEGKTLWGYENMLKKVEQALDDIPVFMKQIRKNEVFKTEYDLKRESVQRGDTIVDNDGTIGISHENRTRKFGEVDGAIRSQCNLKRKCLRIGVEIQHQVIPNVYAPIPHRIVHVPAPVAPVAPVAPIASVAPVAPVAPVELNESDSMVEMWENHKNAIVNSMINVVETFERRASVRIMSENISNEEEFPDGTDFNMTRFVNKICVLPEALRMSGLKFEDGFFCREIQTKAQAKKAFNDFVNDSVLPGTSVNRSKIVKKLLKENVVLCMNKWNDWGGLSNIKKRKRVETQFNHLQNSVLPGMGIICYKNGDNVWVYTKN